MDIWRVAEVSAGSSMPDLIARASRLGCLVTPRDLPPATNPDGKGGMCAMTSADAGPQSAPDERSSPFLLWQEMDDARARASAFLAGADEVIGPWMDRDEALARLLRLMRHGGGSGQHMVLGDLDIDLVDHSARRANRPLDLLAREYALLLHLARHCGRVQSREALLRSIWRLGFDPGTNVVQVHVSRLRAKLDRDFARPMLHTIRGSGYCLVAEG